MFDKIKRLFSVNLRLFDGAAAGGAAPAGPAPATSGTVTQTDSSIPGGSRQDKGDGAVKVVYGKQDTATADAAGKPQAASSAAVSKEGTTLTPEQRKADFEKLIAGEYKDVFAERTQSIIDKRFKETKALEKQFETVSPVLDLLMARYKVDDLGKLAEAVMDDNAYLEEAAEESGLSVEQYKKVLKLESENKALKMQKQEEDKINFARQQYSTWFQQGEELKAIYPNFSLNTECQNNPKFLDLLKSNIDVKTAFELTHIDEIKNNIAAMTAKKVESNVTANIQARGNRPAENGVSNQAGVIVKSDVHQLSKQDRLEIARRVQMGEKVAF